MSFFRNKVAGMDLGTRTLKAIQLKKKRGRVHLDRYFFLDRLLGTDPARDVSETLKALVEINDLKGVPVSSALPDSSVYAFGLTLPAMPEDDLRLAVVNEVSTQLRRPEEELVIDFYVEGSDDGPDGKQLRIRAFCSEKGLVQTHMRTLSKAGVRPYSIESEMQAAVAALRFNEYLNEQTQACVISIGDSSTVICFIVDGEIAATHVEGVGLGEINRLLRERLGLSFEEAERRKLAYRFSDDPSTTTPEQEIVEEVVFRIARSVKESLESFQEAHLGLKLEEAFLIGGGSRFPKLDAVLKMFFGIPTTIPNPFKNIEIYTQPEIQNQIPIGEIAAHMTTAVGLALREIAP